MSFVPKSTEIDPSELIEMNAGNGEFYVCSAGGTPEAPNTFFYADKINEFFFYAKSSTTIKPNYIIEIYETTKMKRRGLRFVIPYGQKSLIEKNISFFFENRHFMLSNRKLNITERPDEVVFTWRVESK